MTKRSELKSDRRRAWRLLSTTAMAAVAGAGLMALAGCDTVAQIPFNDRSFTSIEAGGITPTVNDGGACNWQEDGAGISGGDATLQAVFMDNSSRTEFNFNLPIKIGEDFDGLDDGVELSVDNISMSDGRIYGLPDVACEDDDDCPGGMRCQSFEGDETDRCSTGSATGPASNTPTYIGEEHQTHAIATMISQAGRWRGRYSTDFEGYYEFNPDGPNTSVGDDQVNDVAIDFQGRRTNALQSLRRTWNNLRDYVEADGRGSLFAFYTFEEANNSQISRVSTSDPWTTSSDEVESAINEMPSARYSRSNVYRSMVNTIQDAFGHEDVDDADQRSLFLVVAGHDEVRNSDMEDVIDAAQSQDVEVTIVQVDSALQDPSLLRIDWEYYEGEDTCDTDTDCENFETCAEPPAYVQNPDTNDPNDIVYPTNQGETYCIPDYDENGRIGPIEDYAAIACATGGAYHYIPSNDQTLIGDPMEAQVWIPEAGWAIDFSMDDLVNFNRSDNLLMEMSLEATIVQSRSADFDTDGVRDRRRAVFAAD